ncbi:MAG: type IV pilus biogenesis/stability protein PilW, partial [Chromatiales bacterium]
IHDQDATGDLGSNKRASPADIYVEMGVAYLREGRPAVALQKHKQAIAVDPDSGNAHNVIAILYERLGNLELAEEHFAKAVKLQPRDPFIRNARGSFFCNQGQYQKAEEEYQSALSNPLYPTPWVAMTNAGLCAERSGDMVKAENYYRRALVANEEYYQALYQMAELSLQQGSNLSARGYLERYNAVAEPSAGSLWLGVQIESRLGDFSKARDYQRLLLEKFPDAPEVQLLNQSRPL